MDTNIINLIGLFLNIAGAILIFKYGLPSKIIGGFAIGSNFKGAEKTVQDRRNNKIRCRSGLGLLLLIIGFIFQALSSLFNVICV